LDSESISGPADENIKEKTNAENLFLFSVNQEYNNYENTLKDYDYKCCRSRKIMPQKYNPL
jgi:hypothetical protein